MTKFNKEIKNKSPNAKTRRGSILVYVLVLMTVISIILVSILQYISTQLKFSFNRVEKEKAFQVAEAGIYFYRWYLAHSVDGKTAQQVKAFWQNGDPYGVNIPGNPNYPFKADFFDPEGGKIGEYEIEVEAPDPASTIVVVKSTGYTAREPNLKRVIQARFRRPSWSENMWSVNSFINFGNDATVYGKVHSNTGIRFDGIAHNIVSALPASFNDPSHGGSNLDFGVHTHVVPADPSAPAYPWPNGTVPDRTDIFMAGRQFPVPEISFNGLLSDLDNMKDEAKSGNGIYLNNEKKDLGGGIKIDAGRRVILKNDGTMDVCSVNSYHPTSFEINSYFKNSGSGNCSSCSGQCLSNYAIPDEGIIFIEGNAWVEGSIDNKNITIVAANLSGTGALANMYIGMDNIRYADYTCDNIIGLIAQQNISIIRDCPDDFIVDAALLAQSGRISRANYSFSNKSSLTFNGALASYLQPYFNHGAGGSSFGIRNYNFDSNLLYCPPPYFPTGTEYSIDLWDEL